MEADETVVKDVTILTPHESVIDAPKALFLKQKLYDIIDKGYVKIILNFKDIEFMDSTGLCALVSTHKKLCDKGELKICHLSKHITLLFELVKYHRVINIYDTQEDALKAFQSAKLRL